MIIPKFVGRFSKKKGINCMFSGQRKSRGTLVVVTDLRLELFFTRLLHPTVCVASQYFTAQVHDTLKALWFLILS